MTIIVFLIDTSASMNQRAYLGGRPTLLDVAKSAVETFVKVRPIYSANSFYVPRRAAPHRRLHCLRLRRIMLYRE